MAQRSRPRLQAQVVEETHDWDVAMRDAMHHESVEALRHQIEVERVQKAAMQRSDYYFSLAMLGLTFGLGYSVGGLQPRLPKHWFGK